MRATDSPASRAFTGTGACVDGVVGDCGDAASDGCKIGGYGEISYAAARAIGVYAGPEATNTDPITVEIGVAPDPTACNASTAAAAQH